MYMYIPSTARLLARKGPLRVTPLTIVVILSRVLTPTVLCTPSPTPHTPPTTRPAEQMWSSLHLTRTHARTQTHTCHVAASCSVKHLLIPALSACFHRKQELRPLYIHVHVNTHTCTYRKSDCLGCAVLLCLVCLFDLACFFLSSFSSLI